MMQRGPEGWLAQIRDAYGGLPRQRLILTAPGRFAYRDLTAQGRRSFVSRPSTGTARSGALRPAAVFGAVGGWKPYGSRVNPPTPPPVVVSPPGAQPASISSARNPASRSAS